VPIRYRTCFGFVSDDWRTPTGAELIGSGQPGMIKAMQAHHAASLFKMAGNRRIYSPLDAQLPPALHFPKSDHFIQFHPQWQIAQHSNRFSSRSYEISG